MAKDCRMTALGHYLVPDLYFVIYTLKRMNDFSVLDYIFLAFRLNRPFSLTAAMLPKSLKT